MIRNRVLEKNLLSKKEISATVFFATLIMFFLSKIYYVSQEFTALLMILFLYKSTLKEHMSNKEFVVFIFLNIILLSFLSIIGIENLIRIVSGSVVATLIFVTILFLLSKLNFQSHNK